MPFTGQNPAIAERPARNFNRRATLLFSRQAMGRGAAGTKYEASVVRGRPFGCGRLLPGFAKWLIANCAGVDAFARPRHLDCWLTPGKAQKVLGRVPPPPPVAPDPAAEAHLFVHVEMVDTGSFAALLLRFIHPAKKVAHSAGSEKRNSGRFRAACERSRKTSRGFRLWSRSAGAALGRRTGESLRFFLRREDAF